MPVAPIRRLTGYTAEQILRGGSRRLGERLGLQWLTYNPLVMRYYHQLALADAPAVVAAFEEIFPATRRWVDVGAGSGAFSAEARRRGKTVTACEHSVVGRLYARRQGVDSRPFDLESEPPAVLEGPFDLAFCFEVAEHLAPALGDRLVTFIVGLAPQIVFTAAHPGQGGYGHVNEQNREYWIDRFEAVRAAYRPEVAGALRAAFVAHGVSAPWLLENVMVFEAR